MLWQGVFLYYEAFKPVSPNAGAENVCGQACSEDSPRMAPGIIL